MKFLIVLSCIGMAAADVSHLGYGYTQPQQSSINYGHSSGGFISSPSVNTYQTTQQQFVPEISYAGQASAAPTFQIIDLGYDSGLTGNGYSGNSYTSGSGYSGNSYTGSSGVSGDSGYYGNVGYTSGGGGSGVNSVSGGGGGSYDSGLSGNNAYQGGYSAASNQQSQTAGQYNAGGGQVEGGYNGYNGRTVGISHGRSGNVIRTINNPVLTSNNYVSSVGTQYGSNGGYVYARRH